MTNWFEVLNHSVIVLSNNVVVLANSITVLNARELGRGEDVCHVQDPHAGLPTPETLVCWLIVL